MNETKLRNDEYYAIYLEKTFDTCVFLRKLKIKTQNIHWFLYDIV